MKRNPPSNALKPGIALSDVVEAITSSGYPLQSVVATKLRKHFGVQEEWSFVDHDERVLRSIDMIAERRMWDSENQKRIRPTLNLIVECKRSELPYVFFLSGVRVWTPRFPAFAGLAHDGIIVTTDDDPSTSAYDVVQALSLEGHAFLTSDVTFCTTFSRCERQG